MPPGQQLVHDWAGLLGLPRAKVDGMRRVLREPHAGHAGVPASRGDLTRISNCLLQSLHSYSYSGTALASLNAAYGA